MSNRTTISPEKIKGFFTGKKRTDAESGANLEADAKTWIVTSRTPAGEKVTTKISSVSRSRARMMVSASGNQVEEVNEAKSIWQFEFGAKVPGKVLLQVTRQMAAFTSAGISVLDALQLLAESTKHKTMKATLVAMVEDIRDGDTLPRAASEHSAVFPDYYIAILGSAERSGDLTQTFETLAVYLERDISAARALKSAMYYPAVLFGIGTLAIFVLSIYVLPKFEVFFQSLDTDLPWATQMLLVGSRFVGTWWYLLAAAILAIIVGFVVFRRTTNGRFLTDQILLNIPVVGPLVKLVALERFCRILGSLSETGVPLTDSLKLSADVMGNTVFQQGVIKAREGVIGGRGLAEPLAETGIFPAEAVQIFRVGEQSGLLSRQLSHASNFYSGEVDYRLKNLTALIEPLVLLLVGGGTGFVAVALVSAMYGIYSSQTIGG